jgi:hypothetical protein
LPQVQAFPFDAPQLCKPQPLSLVQFLMQPKHFPESLADSVFAFTVLLTASIAPAISNKAIIDAIIMYFIFLPSLHLIKKAESNAF